MHVLSLVRLGMNFCWVNYLEVELLSYNIPTSFGSGSDNFKIWCFSQCLKEVKDGAIVTFFLLVLFKH